MNLLKQISQLESVIWDNKHNNCVGGMLPFKMPGSPPKKSQTPPNPAPPKIPGLPVPVFGKAPPKLPKFMIAEEDRDRSPPRKPQKTKKGAFPTIPGKSSAMRKLFVSSDSESSDSDSNI